MSAARAGHAVAIATCAAAVAFAPAAHAQSNAAVPALASSTALTADRVWSGAQDVALYALGLIGVNYRYGGNTPDRGLDCSGLVGYVFAQVTGVSLPRASRALSGLGAKVGADDLEPGDLVFFDTRRFRYSHVGIYLGDNLFIHAPSRGKEVEVARLSESYWRRHFNGARRLVGVLPTLVPNLIASAAAGTLPPAATPAETPSAPVEIPLP
ncbi:MAG: C40 family peptidase [Burkholderiales bacterium]|nr:C40 family peptidase [Burkholderiales bacterium]